jgi:hypothetical protein
VTHPAPRDRDEYVIVAGFGLRDVPHLEGCSHCDQLHSLHDAPSLLKWLSRHLMGSAT